MLVVKLNVECVISADVLSRWKIDRGRRCTFFARALLLYAVTPRLAIVCASAVLANVRGVFHGRLCLTLDMLLVRARRQLGERQAFEPLRDVMLLI